MIRPRIDPDREYTPDEAGPLVGRAARTVREWCAKGHVRRYRRAGLRLLLIPGSELVRLRKNPPPMGNPRHRERKS